MTMNAGRNSYKGGKSPKRPHPKEKIGTPHGEQALHIVKNAPYKEKKSPHMMGGGIAYSYPPPMRPPMRVTNYCCYVTICVPYSYKHECIGNVLLTSP